MAFAAAVTLLASAPPGSISAAVGIPGTGKTRTVKEALAQSQRVVVFDPHAARDRLERARGRDTFPWEGDLWTARQLLEHPEALDTQPLRLVVDPGEYSDRLGRTFSAVADLVWSTGDIDLVAEEAALYSREAIHSLRRIATGGRHAGVRLFLLSQSFGLIYVDARRCCSRLVVFAQGEPGDLTELGKRCGKGFAQRVSSLVPGNDPALWRQGELAA